MVLVSKMYKNILIIGAARSGKTTLAKKIAKEKGYSLISVDDIVSGLEVYPELQIHHDGDAVDTAKRLAPFLIKYLTELSEGSTFYDGIKSVIEGTHIDFEQLMPFLQSNNYKEKYEINQTNYTYRYYYNINDILCIKQDCTIKQCRCKQVQVCYFW